MSDCVWCGGRFCVPGMGDGIWRERRLQSLWCWCLPEVLSR